MRNKFLPPPHPTGATTKPTSFSVSTQAFAALTSWIAETAGSTVPIDGAIEVAVVGGQDVLGLPLTQLREAHESFFRDWMEG